MSEQTQWRIDHCRSCSAPIIWAVTDRDKPTPVDATPVYGGNLRIEARGQHQAPRVEVVTPKLTFGVKMRRSHYASCPDGAKWRRRDRPRNRA